ncbi:unnamed protein product [Fraxinus pennsylvanica]|uniref:Pentatricopeptide repeat-containing protein n=1 Tax=Fraxinus pennsylvanica TaxID=56036 RepID=A0AAD2DQ12_9LAMI|nr:unnamed protein product [Fraxinus pennsylvanica]
MGKSGKPGLARSLFEEMVDSGIAPDEKTLTALIKIYGQRMDFILYNTFLSMCADIGLEEEAEKLFGEMEGSEKCRPDCWSYTAMLNIYGSGGNVEKAMALFNEMSKVGSQCHWMYVFDSMPGEAKKTNDLVRVFDTSVKGGVKPDDRLCGCLLSNLLYCQGEDMNKLLNEKSTDLDIVKEEFRIILRNMAAEARRPFCNCLVDICQNRNHNERAPELLYMGIIYGVYPGLHTKSSQEWRLNVQSLSVGASHTAFEEWMSSLAKIIQRQEPLPLLLMWRNLLLILERVRQDFSLQFEKIYHQGCNQKDVE